MNQKNEHLKTALNLLMEAGHHLVLKILPKNLTVKNAHSKTSAPRIPIRMTAL